MRLIDADKMRDDWLENGENEYVYDTNAVLESIDEQPTVDAAPVVHGRLGFPYLDEYFGQFADCKECGTDNILPCNYCRECGAKMDK